jgi:hypothetical protein
MNLPPAQLWIGPHHSLTKHVCIYLQNIFCPQKGCTTCITCQHIKQRQHHAISWLEPIANYTLEQISELQHRMSFLLEDNTYHFFILQQINYLTPLCSNRLLKSIEEPPPGYHFILCAQQKEGVLKTIQSRCVIRTFSGSDSAPSTHPLYIHFTRTDPDPVLFEKDLLAHLPNEQESNELVHEIFRYWILAGDTSCTAILAQALKMPPMPGSSKLFWKNLYLDLLHYISTNSY